MISKIIKILQELYPNAHCELNHNSPFQLLIATILSAQCTDVMVNKVTPLLFEHFPDAPSMAKASIEEIAVLIKSIGLYKNKAKHLSLCSKMLIDSYNDIIPQTMDELVKLPGVGRKTANVLLSNAFNIHHGVVVDTHVKRISFRLGLTTNTDVSKIEQDLMAQVPQHLWGQFSHWIIFLGRRMCFARTPNCLSCPLNKLCLFFESSAKPL